MPAWELQEVLWLTGVVLDNQNRTLLDRFQEINSINYGCFQFGEEIIAHQFVERAIKSCNIHENPSYILDNFDLTLTSNNQCILTGGWCGQGAGGHGDEVDDGMLTDAQEIMLSPASRQLPKPLYPARRNEHMLVSHASKEQPRVQRISAQPQLVDTMLDSEANSASVSVSENEADTENITNSEEKTVMNKEERMETKEPRSVTIKRKSRNGQKREGGVKVRRIEDLFKASNGSQEDGIAQPHKRKLPGEEKPLENKRRRKFGQ